MEGEENPELLSLILNSLHALDKMPEKPLRRTGALVVMCIDRPPVRPERGQAPAGQTRSVLG